MSDFVLLVLSAETEVDEAGEQILRAIETQGISNVLTVVHGLAQIEPPKRRPQVLSSLKSFIGHFFPNQDKINSLGSLQECSNVVRSLCTTTPKGIRWREDRSWMLVEDVRWEVEGTPDTKTAVLTGVVRGRGLNANRLLQIGDWGDFQIDKITTAPPLQGRKRKAEDMAVETEDVLQVPDEDRDDLGELAPGDIVMDTEDATTASLAPSERKGVLLDDHHYFSDEEAESYSRPKRLPRGTSDYQAAWYLNDVSDSGSDLEDEDMDLADEASTRGPLPQDGVEGLDRDGMEQTEGGPSEYPQSELFVDASPEEESKELAAYRSNRKRYAEEDLEFPDEIELHPNVLARERLSRYRGLKSLRTSRWETDEDRAHEPEDWNRLLQAPDYKATRSRVTREALVGGVQPGTRVHVYVKSVPAELEAVSADPVTTFSLLRHEHKQAVMNFSITLSSDYPEPIKSKDELLIQYGPRRLVIKPLFSAPGNTPNDVHKFDRFLHPGHTAMATAIAPVLWGPVPTLVFRRPSSDSEAETIPAGSLELIGSGTVAAPSSNRVIAKRVILTGHPYKIHKKVVTVRYMFFNYEDVQWFKALQLWTKRGRSGFIKESLGTHGHFKATFDQRINPQDAVGISLYKRVFPRPSRRWSVHDGRAMNAKGKGAEVVGEMMATE